MLSLTQRLTTVQLHVLTNKSDKEGNGVATFVQGTVVQGDHGPRGQMSKEILVRGDFCPRKLLPVISLLKLFFFILYWILQY